MILLWLTHLRAPTWQLIQDHVLAVGRRSALLQMSTATAFKTAIAPALEASMFPRLLVTRRRHGFHGGILLPVSYLHFPKGQLSGPAGPGL